MYNPNMILQEKVDDDFLQKYKEVLRDKNINI